MSSYGNVYSTLILVFWKKLFCADSFLFWPLIVTSNMYMVKQHTLDLKTDKGLFNSSQIIPITGSQRRLNLRAKLKTSWTTIELRAAVLFQNVSDCNNGKKLFALKNYQLFNSLKGVILLQKRIYSNEYYFYYFFKGKFRYNKITRVPTFLTSSQWLNC